MRLALACTLLAPLVSGHAILLDVSSGGSVAYPRTGISGTQGTGAGISGSGTKLQPFADAKIYADETKCGGAVKNKDPGVETPLVAFSPNDVLTVKWRMTIPHPIDYPLDAPDNTASPGSGVRIAMHYGATDSFEDNILAGGVAGDPGVGTLAAGTSEDDPGRNGEVTATITLDAAKTCDYCTLQWIWAANNDGGSYLMCVDLSITADGQLPDFSAIPSEVGKLVAGVLAPPLPPGVVARPPPPPGNVGGVPANGSGNQQAGGGGGGAAGPVIGVIVALAVVGGAVYWYTKVRGKTAGPGAPPPTPAAAPPPPPPEAPSDLPEGWESAPDPTTGVTYYFNPSTKQTQWTKPT